MRRSALRRCVAALVTVGMLAMVLAAADWRQVLQHAREVRPAWLAGGMMLFVPLVAGAALRWRAMVRPWRQLGVAEACGQVLACSALNLALPSKLGDFSKAGFLQRDPAAHKRPAGGDPSRDPGCAQGEHSSTRLPTIPLAEASALVLAEKLLDLLALMLLWAGGLLVTARGAVDVALLACIAICLAAAGCWICRYWRFEIPLRGSELAPGWRSAIRRAYLATRRVAAVCAQRPGVAVGFLAFSLALWVLHLTQIALFFRAAGVGAPSQTILTRVPLAIFAGLVPWSVGGIGPRDSALVVLFRDVAAPAPMAVIGMLTALRYLVPGVVGLPLLHRYLRGHCWQISPETASAPRRPASTFFAATSAPASLSR